MCIWKKINLWSALSLQNCLLLFQINYLHSLSFIYIFENLQYWFKELFIACKFYCLRRNLLGKLLFRMYIDWTNFDESIYCIHCHVQLTHMGIKLSLIFPDFVTAENYYYKYEMYLCMWIALRQKYLFF